jgi:ketosteroid isomerase-like protein
VPQSRLELSREATAALNRRDIEALERLCDPGVEFHSRLAASEGRVYVGYEGIRRYLTDIDESFESFERELTEVVEVGDKVVVGHAVRAVGRGSGLRIDQEVWVVNSFAGDRATRVEVFVDRDEALAAAGE